MLAPGAKIGAFEIVGTLGTGGMGEVYRARDTRLDREVAIKILPEISAGAPDRLMRFAREAKTLASLNHPHIAQIYGVEEDGASAAPKHALVMELVDGEDLSQRIARGPLPIVEAIAIATQIAEALEAAHDAGIVHRDLKPANVRVRRDGTVKVLDFGLAKASASAPADSPTLISAAATGRGMILGTPPYMSPEQARSSEIDKRTDIWAFGCVLYEMLTGRRAFDGATTTDVVAAVIEREPDWTRLPPSTPAALHRVLRRSLAKNRRHRLADISDARLELADAGASDGDVAGRSVAVTPNSWRTVALLTAAAALVAAVIAYMLWPERAPVAVATVRSSLIIPPGERISHGVRAVAIDPNGSFIFFATDKGLYLRALHSFESRRLGVERGGNAAFSPDGFRLP